MNRFQRIVDAWISAQDAPEETPECENWATRLVKRWPAQKRPDKIWRLIIEVMERNVSEDVQMMVGESLLDVLLINWGLDYIDRYEELARKDKRFLLLSHHIWGYMDMDRRVLFRLRALPNDNDS